MFETVKPTRISDQILAQLRRLILEGKIKPGERLPAETELAKKFGVSRASLREALTVLESEELVERRKNGGTFLRQYSLKEVLDAVEIPSKLDNELFADFIEARERIELQIVELAALRADDVNLLCIERTIELMEQDIAEGLSGVEADILFHQCLGVATKNQILAGMVRSIENLMQETRSKTLSYEGRLKECLKEHKAIFEAIRDHDAERGVAVMKDHLAKVRDIMSLI